ncbi:hypothetical protein GCM10010095_40590 [Streptomyces anthocyanicus]|uniref:Uncharacterized protein n=1 Tax=Streptomyces violaceolatus TaxID=67378 RepID=A0ABN3SL24_9ACTN|nr:hypothetical protein JCM4020_75290 [Streptomyces coelicolor]BDE43998.1 hypothetical protein SLITK23_72430 [Streptomyces lividans]GGL51610.1 hypothetical protein GCM10010095_40590 [Streptomyces anthocyanicus]GHC13491.1 hypothetical protein GCM10010348_40980 [Streptomyces anthocyanicus]
MRPAVDRGEESGMTGVNGAPLPAIPAAGPVSRCGYGVTRSSRTTMPLEVGWLLMSATLSSGTRTWVSG